MARSLVTMVCTPLIACALAYGTAFPEEIDPQSTPQSTVKIGTYRDLGFLRKLKLGTASYVNPRLLDMAATGYRYSLDDLVDNIDCEQKSSAWIYRALVEGQVMFANGGQNGEFQVVSPDDAPFQDHIHTCESFKSWAGQRKSTNAALVSVYSSLDEVSGTPVVAWAAEEWTGQDDL